MLFLDALMSANATQLPTPTNLATTPVSDTQLDVTWSQGGAYDTQVWRDGSLLTTVSSGTTTYSDTTVAAGFEYQYKVRHYNGTSYSVFTLEVPGVTAPPAPVMTSVVQNGADVDVEWTDGGSSAHTAVRVYRDYVQISGELSPGDLTYKDVAPGAGTYVYTVRNYDSTIPAESADSTTGNLTVLGTPSAPTFTSAIAGGETTVDLLWSNGETDAEIEVYRDTFSTPTTLRSTEPAGTTSYEDTGLSASTLYYYRLRHKRFGMYSGYVSDSETTDAPPTPPPADPVFTSVTPSYSDRNDLVWTTDGTSEVEIYRDTFDPPTTLRTTEPAGTTTWSDVNLDQSTLFYYRLRHKAAGPLYSGYVADNATTLTTTITGQSLYADQDNDLVSVSFTITDGPVAPDVQHGTWSDTSTRETAGAATGLTTGDTVVPYEDGIIPSGGTSVTGTLTYLRVKNGLGITLDTINNMQVDFKVGDP